MAWTLDEFEAQMRKDLRRYGHGDRGIEDVPNLCEESGVTRKRWRIFSDINCYVFNASTGQRGDRIVHYLGCIASCRKPRAGEDWTRGSDLADGPLCMETWHRILADIVSYEMVKIHPAKEALARAWIDMPALQAEISARASHAAAVLPKPAEGETIESRSAEELFGWP